MMGTGGKIRVFLADDHTVVRQGLRLLLESDEQITVAGEAGDGRTAVDMIARLRPHVVLMDVALPGLNGIEATRQMAKASPTTRVLMLTMHSDDAYVQQSLQAGVHGYMLKDAEDVDLIKAVKAVAGGESFFSPAVSKLLLERYRADGVRHDIEDELGLLTDREREVLQLIAEGKSNKEVASVLNISVSTVESHRKHLMEKLDLHNTAGIVRFAIRKKVIA
jgi:two-component system response regulator NreC